MEIKLKINYFGRMPKRFTCKGLKIHPKGILPSNLDLSLLIEEFIEFELGAEEVEPKSDQDLTVLPDEVVGCKVSREKDAVEIYTHRALLTYNLASGNLMGKTNSQICHPHKPWEKKTLSGEGNAIEAVIQRFAYVLNTYQLLWTPFFCRKLFSELKEIVPPHLYSQLSACPICQSADKRLIAYAEEWNDIAVWDVKAQQKVGMLQFNQKVICSMAFGNFSDFYQRYQLVISFANPEVIQIWELNFSTDQFQPLNKITLHSDDFIFLEYVFQRWKLFIYFRNECLDHGMDLQSKKKRKEYKGEPSSKKITGKNYDSAMFLMGINEEKGLIVGRSKSIIYLWNILNAKLLKKIILTEACGEVILSEDAEFMVVNSSNFISAWKLIINRDKLDAQLLWQKAKPENKFTTEDKFIHDFILKKILFTHKPIVLF